MQSISSSSRENASLFESLPGSRTGIDLIHKFPDNAPFALLQDQGAGTGVCAGDYDGDGLPDLFITNYDRGNRLYRNLGNWRFDDVTARAGVGGNGRWCGGASFVDIDNDRDLDLYVCVFNGPNLLFVNQGDGTFQERARAFGLDFKGASVIMAFGDYDRDGHLDGYLVTHRLALGTDYRLPKSSKEASARALIQQGGPGKIQIAPAYRESFDLIEKGQGRVELIIAGQKDHLFHNNRNGTFSDVSAAAGIRGNDIGLAGIWWDYNDDGWPDIYVSNDYKGPDRLYRNRRDGTFTEEASSALPQVPWSSMGTDIADINNDGRIDLIATDMAGTTYFRRRMIHDDLDKDRWFLALSNPKQLPRNTVYLGTGRDRVFEVAQLAGLERSDWTWSPKFADFDNNGWVDLFVANGMSRDFLNGDLLARMAQRDNPGWRSAPVLREKNLAFRNLGDLQFKSVGKEWGLDQLTASFGATVADFDRDGNLDLVVTHFGEAVSVFRNNDGASGHRVLLRLKGTHSNSWGIGATVKLVGSWGVQTRYLTLTSGFMSANEPLLHFGLGSEKKIERLTIRWPSGREQTFANLDVDRLYTVTEPAEAVTARDVAASKSTWFRPSHQITGARHREAPYDDFEREPLLPWKLSRLGPGLAVGDIDDDGDEDFYLGGASGQSGAICVHEADGRFIQRQFECFERDKASEDMGALFFDVDGDGDLDLYVVSGGVEGNGPALRDRLYINDGKGGFTKAPDSALPEERDAGSVAAAADFDQDGDLDLFVGGRCVPGQYPLPARNRLLRNEQGRFTDVTELQPQLRETGLVTSAVWSDANGDGWMDLLVTHEWGPIRVFINQQGHFVERTREAGLERKLGCWNGIVARDLDGDGDIDYVVTNLGLNTQYRASDSKPILAFYGDFNGSPQFIEASYEEEMLYPLRGRSVLFAAIPSLSQRYPNFKQFASASLHEIFSSAKLDAALRLELTTLESGVLLNDGHARFTFVPLPRVAQTAPAFGVAVEDFDADGKPDLCLAQNCSSAPLDVGPMSGGLSLLLRGQGDGTFAPVWPDESGLVISGDARALVTTDLNRDGWPDLLFGINDGEVMAVECAALSKNRLLLIVLKGKSGNPSAIGARITVLLSDGSRQCSEVTAGGGYLSQNSPVLHFGLRKSLAASEIKVRWPDGSASSVSLVPGQRSLTLKHP